MLVTIILLNNKFTLDTEISETETINEFMDRFKIYESVPNEFKWLIANNKKVDNNEPIINYIKDGKLYFWFKLRWFI